MRVRTAWPARSARRARKPASSPCAGARWAARTRSPRSCKSRSSCIWASDCRPRRCRRRRSNASRSFAYASTTRSPPVSTAASTTPSPRSRCCARAASSRKRLGASGAQFFVEEAERAWPGQFRGRGVVARGRVVVEAVLDVRIDVRLIAYAGGLEGGFVGGPARIDALVVTSIVDQQRGFDPGRLCGGRLCAVEWNGGGEIGDARREEVRDSAPVAETDHADLPVAAGERLEISRRREEIVPGLRLIELGEEVAGLVFVVRVPAERRQRVRREGDEVVDRQTSRDIFDVRIEAAILVHDEYGGQLAGGFCRSRDVCTHLSGAVRRGVLDASRGDARVRFLDLRRLGKARRERVQECFSGDAGGGIARRRFQEVPSSDDAVNVLVEELENFGMKIPGGLA